MTSQISRIVQMVLLKMRITDRGVGHDWQRQSGARAGKDSQSCSHLLSRTKNWSKMGKKSLWTILHLYNQKLVIFFKLTQALNCINGAFQEGPVPAKPSETRPGISLCYRFELLLPGRDHVLVRCYYTDTVLKPPFPFLPFLVLLGNSLVPFTLYCTG